MVECCGEDQTIFLSAWFCYAIACLLLWNVSMLLPLKLFTVFLHELSHAIAAWCTGSTVTGIEVYRHWMSGLLFTFPPPLPGMLIF